MTELIEKRFGVFVDFFDTLVSSSRMPEKDRTSALFRDGPSHSPLTELCHTSGMDPRSVREFYMTRSFMDREDFRAFLEAESDTGVDDIAWSNFLSEVKRSNESFNWKDGAREFLDELSSMGVTVVLVSNTSSFSRDVIDRLEACEYFDDMILSNEVGVAKPCTKIFQLALSRNELAADNTLMIGNSLTSDVFAANSAGLEAVWFREPIEPSWLMNVLCEGRSNCSEFRVLSTFVEGFIERLSSKDRPELAASPREPKSRGRTQ